MSGQWYPPRQPFPRSTAVRGDSAEASGSAALEPIRTLETGTFIRARRELESYLNDYGPEPEEGLAMGIEGPHGSGKTHLIRHLRAAATEKFAEAVQVYVKLGGPDPLEMYRAIMAGVDLECLRDVNTLFLVELAKQQALNADTSTGAGATVSETEAASPSAGTVADAFARGLSKDPAAVYEYLDSALLSRSQVERTQSAWVHQITKADDFFHAVSYLQDPLRSSDAYNWFRGETLTGPALARLGIGSPIDTPERAKGALFFLAAVFQRARRPLLVFLDQLERLMPEGDAALATSNVALLSELAEWFHDNQAFLCVAGASQAWAAAAPDFRPRFRRVYAMPRLTADDAVELIRVYFAGLENYDAKLAGDEGIFPFGRDAVCEMVRIADGNARGILRLAYQAFQDNESHETIGPAEIKNAFRKFDEYFDQRSISAQIKELLGKNGLPYMEEVRAQDGGRIDFAIPDVADPVALIEISDAVFHEDEMRKAIRYVDSASSLRRQFPRVRLILVIAGYVSAEVMERLRGITDALYVYSPERFAAEFGNGLAPLRSAISASTGKGAAAAEKAPVARATGPNEKTLAEVRKEFEELLERRLRDSERLKAGTEVYSAQQLAEERRRATSQVAAARRAIEDAERARVAAALERKEKREAEQREQERSLAEQARKWRALMYGGISAAVLVVAGLLTYAPAHGPKYIDIGLYVPALIVAAAIYGGVIYFTQMRRNGQFEPARRRVPDLRVLDQVAARIARSSGTQEFEVSRALRDGNPQVRYVAARAAALNPSLVTRQTLLDALFSGTWTWLRPLPHLLSALVRGGSGGGSLANDLANYMLSAGDSEVLYGLEAIPAVTNPDDLEYRDAWRRVAENLRSRPLYVTVHAVCLKSPGWEPKPGSTREAFVYSFAAGLSGGAVNDTKGGRLADLFLVPAEESRRSGGKLRQAGLEGLTPEQVDELLRLFGPGDEQSLGYYDDLQKAGFYRDVYRFLLGIRLELEDLDVPYAFP